MDRPAEVIHGRHGEDGIATEGRGLGDSQQVCIGEDRSGWEWTAKDWTGLEMQAMKAKKPTKLTAQDRLRMLHTKHKVL